MACFWSGALAAIAATIVVGQARAQTAVPASAPSQQYGGQVQSQAFAVIFPDASDGHAHVARPGDPFPIYCVSGCSGSGGSGGAVTEAAGGFADLTTIISNLSTLNTSINSLLKSGQSVVVGSMPASTEAAGGFADLTTIITAIGTTNTNTGAGAKESGGNLAAAKADLDTLAARTVQAVAGAAATGAAVSGNPLLDGCRAATAAPTAVTDGQAVPVQCGVEGKQIVLPYSVKELAFRGAASTTGTGATTVQAAPGASLKLYVTAMQCWNTSATTVLVTLNDTASTPIIDPAGTGNNPVFPTPLALAANTALTFTASAAATTVGCSGQGYTGP